jgi:hypothetical protein
MKTKKSKSKKTTGVTTRTWVLFIIFLVVSFYCLKVVFAAQKMVDSVVIPTPIPLITPAKTVTPVHKTVKR